jgi:glycosyltransferase involved in cell wall biosynthesis
MKILHLIDAFDARFERDQVKLVESLEKRGYQNTIITSRYSSDWRFIKKAEFENWEKKISNTQIIHAPSFKIPTPFSNELSPIYLPSRQILSNFDIIHAYTFNTYSSLLGAASKIIRKSKVVMRSDLSSATYDKVKNAPFQRTIATYPFKIADAVYTFTYLEKQYLTNLGVNKNKIRVIPVGIDYKKFSKATITDEDKHTSIGYVGRLCPQKGVRRITASLQRILSEEKNASVTFAGGIEDTDYAEEVLASLRTYRNFEYLGCLSDVLPFYKMCNIILAPSILETGAITVLEAMASGKVVIASNINPIKEYIEHERTGFLFTEEKEVYVYLKKLIENPKLIKEIGRRARKEVAKYDWNLIIGRYEEMYRSVM